MKLFHARGYDAVGVAELSSELGIKPPSFYAAFGSKAGLFERALQRYAAGEGNVFAHAQATGGNVGAVLERTLLRAAHVYPRRDGAAGCLVLDGTRNSADPEASALSAAARKASCATIRDFVAAHAVVRAEEVADFVMIALLGMSAAARDGADETTLRTFAENAGRALRREFGLE
ncbi:TetR/AcrR family transcriptional regulator [Azospirillum sp. TSO22-1]|uniref:TetR/AcrR family transcriptional regulator n=1 Tax=Azospirillum sp. TSO22-1 TaxID=716789 RepID=UPI001FFE4924|nr:TetR/AcrR family transcriptional regulator [Azospirillum sp. TSO22-1]